jgi:hypothetical protein
MTEDHPPEIPEVVPESAQVLRRAESLIRGDRRNDYGPAAESFANVAALWSVILHRPVASHEVALCLAALKLWRCVTSPGSMDSWTDLCGYGALGWECMVAEAKK